MILEGRVDELLKHQRVTGDIPARLEPMRAWVMPIRVDTGHIIAIELARRDQFPVLGLKVAGAIDICSSRMKRAVWGVALTFS